MKARSSFFCLLSFIFYLLLSPVPFALSQIPQGFNYQAVATNASGYPVANTAIPVMISIQADSLGSNAMAAGNIGGPINKLAVTGQTSFDDPAPGMDGLQMGFIGQEAYEVVPEVVSLKNNRFSMQYAPITALLVEAVKEQQNIIERQQAEIEKLKSMEDEITELKAIVNSLIVK